ncbi:hypothetical protein Pla110_39240 [Polystyrenella longa]|uniref:Uncharacterized protein n=1 Tax=Polystyrenella longa TaxID=2528007 RepID=A0A518CSF2_9PLAN|nr:hypothetical protein Pla110_39240 [Polystyrenella longa]
MKLIDEFVPQSAQRVDFTKSEQESPEENQSDAVSRDN